MDDAAGEAFDKVARMLGLPYPGGPVIEALAKKGNPEAHPFPKARFDDPERLDFSFSGLKTALQYFLEKRAKSRKKVTPKEKADIAASFQHAVTEALTENLMEALKRNKDVKEVHLTGGVSANMYLRGVLEKKLKMFQKETGRKFTFRVPAKLSYCTDNGAMIAGAAFFQHKSDPKKYREWKFVDAVAEFDM